MKIIVSKEKLGGKGGFSMNPPNLSLIKYNGGKKC